MIAAGKSVLIRGKLGLLLTLLAQLVKSTTTHTLCLSQSKNRLNSKVHAILSLKPFREKSFSKPKPEWEKSLDKND
jgi:hypothetical protein